MIVLPFTPKRIKDYLQTSDPELFIASVRIIISLQLLSYPMTAHTYPVEGHL